MSKVKIYTTVPQNFGCEVLFGNDSIKFDKLGYAEVESDLAKELAANYDGWLKIGEKGELKEKAKPIEDLTKLNDELQRTKNTVKDREATIKTVEAECQAWKDELTKYKDLYESLKAEHEGYITQKNKEIDELKLKATLSGQTLKELISICIELAIPEERFKDKTRAELIAIILDESRK